MNALGDGQEPIGEGHLVTDKGPKGTDCPGGTVCSRIQEVNLNSSRISLREDPGSTVPLGTLTHVTL